MGYFLLAIALIAGVTKGYCGKRISDKMKTQNDAIFSNFIRMFFCIIIGFIIIAVQGNLKSLAAEPRVILISILSAVGTSGFVVSWLISVRKGSYMMIDVFLMMGVIIPLLLSALCFGDPIELNHLIGLAILITAVVIMCSYNNQIKTKMTVASFILLVFCGVANGIADFSQRLFTKTVESPDSTVFNFYTYVFSAVILLGFYLFSVFTHKEEKGNLKELVRSSVPIYILIMAACLFANSLFKTEAAHYLSAAELYPLNQGAALILSSAMSVIFFKEKLTSRAIVGIILSFCGLIIINVL